MGFADSIAVIPTPNKPALDFLKGYSDGPWLGAEVICIRDQRRAQLNAENSVPEDIQKAPESAWGDLSRHLQENLAIDGHSTGVLSLAQVRRLLGMSTRFEARQFLGVHGVAVFDFDPTQLEREAKLLRDW